MFQLDFTDFLKFQTSFKITNKYVRLYLNRNHAVIKAGWERRLCVRNVGMTLFCMRPAATVEDVTL